MIKPTLTNLWSSGGHPVVTNSLQTLRTGSKFSDYGMLLVQHSIVVTGQSAGPFATTLIPQSEFATRDAYLSMGRYGCELVHDSDTQFHRTGSGAELGIEEVYGLAVPGNEFTDANKTVVDGIPTWASTNDNTIPVAKLPNIPDSKLPEFRLVPPGSSADNGRVVGYDGSGHPTIIDLTANPGAFDIANFVAAIKNQGGITGDFILLGNGNNLQFRKVNLDDWNAAFVAAGILSNTQWVTAPDGTEFVYITFVKPSE